MNKLRNVIQLLVLIILPVVYFKSYFLVRTNFIDNTDIVFAFNNTMVLIILTAMIVCFFTVILLEVGRRFGKGSYLKKAIVIAILLAHLCFSYFAPEIIMYYMYIEVVSSLMFVIVDIIVESLLDIRSKK